MANCKFFWYDQSRDLWGLKCGSRYWVWDETIQQYVPGLSPAQYKSQLKKLQRTGDTGGPISL